MIRVRLPARYRLIMEAAIDRAVRDATQNTYPTCFLDDEQPDRELEVIVHTVPKLRKARAA